MFVERTATAAFVATFQSEEELLEEHRTNLSFGGLRLPTAETVPLQTILLVTLRGPRGGEAHVRATVVAALAEGIALTIDGDAEERLRRLLAGAGEPASSSASSAPPPAPSVQENAWDRIRGLSQMEKILLAVKADRSERALLLQDNDPRVLLSLLRNPRVTVEEVGRLAKSTFLTYQIAEVIMKAAQWMTSLDVRTGLVHNPKTPPAFALRILPTLPDSDLRTVARAGTNMALKQAALRRLQGKP